MNFFFNYKKFSKATILNYIKNGKKIVMVGNKVYDFTDLNHPGNFDAFLNRIGTDVSKDYNFHGPSSKKFGANIL